MVYTRSFQQRPPFILVQYDIWNHCKSSLKTIIHLVIGLFCCVHLRMGMMPLFKVRDLFSLTHFHAYSCICNPCSFAQQFSYYSMPCVRYSSLVLFHSTSILHFASTRQYVGQLYSQATPSVSNVFYFCFYSPTACE